MSESIGLTGAMRTATFVVEKILRARCCSSSTYERHSPTKKKVLGKDIVKRAQTTALFLDGRLILPGQYIALSARTAVEVLESKVIDGDYKLGARVLTACGGVSQTAGLTQWSLSSPPDLQDIPSSIVEMKQSPLLFRKDGLIVWLLQ